jgi:hypothetical protein
MAVQQQQRGSGAAAERMNLHAVDDRAHIAEILKHRNLP